MKDDVSLELAMSQAIECAEAGEALAAVQGLQRALQGAQPTAQALLRALQAVQAVQEGRFQDALALAVPQLAQLESGPLARRLGWLYTSLAFALGMLGDAERGLGWAARALALSEGEPLSHGRRRALSTQGTLLAMLEQWDEARQVLGECLRVAETQGNQRGQVLGLGNLAYSCVDQAWHLDPQAEAALRAELAEQAMAYARRARPLGAQWGFPVLEGFAANSEGFGLLLLGQPAQALACFEHASPLTEPNPPMHTETRLGLAVAQRQLGQLEAARKHLQHADALAHASHLPQVRGRVLEEGVELEQAAGEPLKALAWSRLGVQHWRRQLAQRVAMLSHSAQLFAELERSRQEAAGLRDRARAWEDAALHDPLTGALNRLGLGQAAQPLWASSAALALLALDADHFKRVNDQFGHGVGDQVLQRLVHLLAAQLRQGDLLARVGGEEFVLLLPGAEWPAARAIAERLRQAVESDDWGALAPQLQVTISLGLAQRQAGEDYEALVGRADAALYRAKTGGRNRVEISP